MHCSIHKEAWYYEFCPDICPWTDIAVAHMVFTYGWCVCVCEVNFVLFNSMLKYVINRIMHAFFHIRTIIIPRPISTLGLKPSGWYRENWHSELAVSTIQITSYHHKIFDNYRLMHALFHIKNVIIPRDDISQRVLARGLFISNNVNFAHA
jgi:hypothetical protein